MILASIATASALEYGILIALKGIVGFYILIQCFRIIPKLFGSQEESKTCIYPCSQCGVRSEYKLNRKGKNLCWECNNKEEHIAHPTKWGKWYEKWEIERKLRVAFFTIYIYGFVFFLLMISALTMFNHNYIVHKEWSHKYNCDIYTEGFPVFDPEWLVDVRLTTENPIPITELHK